MSSSSNKPCGPGDVHLFGDHAYVHEDNDSIRHVERIYLGEGQPIPPGTVFVNDEGGGVGRVVYRHHGEGPAQVATAGYRSGWDAIWGHSTRKDQPS